MANRCHLTNWGCLITSSGPPTRLLLKSGRMLAAIRKQRVPQRQLPGDDDAQLKAMGAWDFQNKFMIKHGFLANSDDQDYTWHH
jgi:hypothetical protein